jgi:hypothetical protein
MVSAISSPGFLAPGNNRGFPKKLGNFVAVDRLLPRYSLYPTIAPICIVEHPSTFSKYTRFLRDRH